MLNRAPLNSRPLNSAGNADLVIRYYAEAVGQTSVYNAFEAEGVGKHGIVIRNYTAEGSGHAVIYWNFEVDGAGRHQLGATTYRCEGVGAHKTYVNFQPEALGASVVYNGFAVEGLGASAVAVANYSAEAVGAHAVGYDSYSAEGAGKSAVMVRYDAELAGLTRIADDGLSRYELYIGVDGDPDFSAAPDETFTSLPYETAALTPGHVYKLVVRQRNAYNLQSKNVVAWELDLDGAGNENSTPPSAPVDVSLVPAAAGAVRVQAGYSYIEDGNNQADKFLIYLTSTGVDPDPVLDTPIESLMVKSDGVAKLDYTSSQFADGSDIRVLVRTRRSGSPDVDSTNSTILTTTADTVGPVEPSGVAMFGKIAGQR